MEENKKLKKRIQELEGELSIIKGIGNNSPEMRALKKELQEVKDDNVKLSLQINDLISKEIEGNEVCLFMKGTPDAPQCGFSMAVSNMLKILEVNFKGVNVLEDEKLRQGIKEFSDWPTIPQVYVKGEFIGGSDILISMYNSGELKEKLEIALAS